MSTEAPCTVHHDGHYYDLNPLSRRDDYELKSLGDHKFILNVCRSVASETWALKVSNTADVGAFIRLDHGDFSLGVTNTTLDVRGSSPVLHLISGSQCTTDNRLTGSTTIQFICDRYASGSGFGRPTLIAQLPPQDEDACSFFLEWRTRFACPTSERGLLSSPFAIILLTIILLLLLYLILGTLYNRIVLKLSGFNQIPHFSWTSLKYHASAAWDILSDVVQGFYEKFQGAHAGAAASSMGGNRNRETNPHSHQWMNRTDGPSMAGNADDDMSSPGRRRFDWEQRPVPASTAERQSLISPSGNDGEVELEENPLPPISPKKGIDSSEVIRL